MTYLGRENDFVKSLYSLTLFETKNKLQVQIVKYLRIVSKSKQINFLTVFLKYPK